MNKEEEKQEQETYEYKIKIFCNKYSCNLNEGYNYKEHYFNIYQKILMINCDPNYKIKAKIFGSYLTSDEVNDIDIAFCDKETMLAFMFDKNNLVNRFPLIFHYCLLEKAEYDDLVFSFSIIKPDNLIFDFETRRLERYHFPHFKIPFYNPIGKIRGKELLYAK